MEFLQKLFPQKSRALTHLNPLMLGGRNVLPTHLYLVRHGQSKGNADDATYGEIHDAAMPMSALGHQQIREAGHAGILPSLLSLAKELGRPINVGILYSGYVRTVESKDELIDVIFDDPRAKDLLKLVLRHEDPNLVERRYGEASRYSAEEYEVKYGDRIIEASFAPVFHRDLPGGVESDFRLCRRAQDAMGNIFRLGENYLCDAVIVVSHKDLLRALEKCYLGLDEARYEALPPPGNASVRLIERMPFYDPHRCPENPALNDRIKSFDLGYL